VSVHEVRDRENKKTAADEELQEQTGLRYVVLSGRMQRTIAEKYCPINGASRRYGQNRPQISRRTMIGGFFIWVFEKTGEE
jgi:hypothetical protein